MDKLEFMHQIFFELDGNIEIREIKDESKQIFFNSIEEFSEYKPPRDKNVYFGVFTRKGKNGRAKGCITTGTLWADFDHIELKEVLNKIHKSNLPNPSIIVQSGHGIHTYWLLDKRAGNEAIGLIKAIANATGADIKATDKARILRLPNTINVKSEPYIECKVVESNCERYSLEIFKLALDDQFKPNKNETVKEIEEFKNCQMACIKSMIKGVKGGHRNFALCKITKWLQLRGYSRKKTLEIIRQWNLLNDPVKEDKQILIEFNKVWDTDYKFLSCKFSSRDLQEHQEHFCGAGECPHHSRQEMKIIDGESTSKIDNKVFKDSVYPKIKGITLAIYFTIAKAEAKGITRDQLAKLVGRDIKNNNFVNSIKELVRLEFIIDSEGIDKKGIRNTLKVNSLSNYGRGYTLINNLLSEVFLGGRLTDMEYKLLILLKSYTYGKEEVYPTIETLAAKMGSSENSISNVLRRLEEKLYIKRNYITLDNGKTKLIVKLKY